MKPRDRLAPAIEAARELDPRPVRAAADEPITAERIERDMVLMAFIIASREAPELVPLLDRLERELALYRQERDPMSRARRVLRDHTVNVDDTGNAIR